ncbi:MAG: hypothetical protein PHY93_12630 [Bacteriovorax sp.]|nr:hypothetical protein [Bacteriovorax sp.]
MNKILTILFLLSTIISCSSVSKAPKNLEEILDRAETTSSLVGRRILKTSRSMITNKEIIIGGCWDYINTVYDRAGFLENQRTTIFKSKLKGPYLKTTRIEPGDWLYYVNHSYSNTEHSAIFVAWTDEENHVALMVSYMGENKKRPAEYKRYTISNIYNVIRARD